jgi:hypothetical protein
MARGWIVGPEEFMPDIVAVSLANVVVPVGIAQDAVATALGTPTRRSADISQSSRRGIPDRPLTIGPTPNIRQRPLPRIQFLIEWLHGARRFP